MTTTTSYDAHRTMEENLFNNFHQRHSSIHSPATASLTSFRSMTASDLIGLLPGTPHSSQPYQHRQQQQQHRHQQRARMARTRPASDFINSHLYNGPTHPQLTESEEIDEWFENIQRYEQLLEEVAEASLDETFKDELHHVNQWIRCRSDAERTAALYSIVQNASQIQIRFLIMVLQQLVNQEPFGNFLTSAGQDKDSLVAPVAGSVVSTESEYERRKRQLYPSGTHRRGFTTTTAAVTATTSDGNPMNHTRSAIRITSASSEPDDLGRRNRGFFSSSSGRSLADSITSSSIISSGALGRQGLLHEKALAARAQIQAANGNRMAAAAATLASAKSNAMNGRLQPHLTNTSSTPTSLSPSSASSLDNNSVNSSNNTLQQQQKHSSLFGNRNNGNGSSNGSVTDWPFPMTRQERPSTIGRIGDYRSASSKSSIDDAWSFGSLSKKKKELMDLPSWNGRRSGPIREEQESPTNSMASPSSTRSLNNRLPPSPSLSKSTGTNGGGMLTSSLNNSLNTLELAQARLRAEHRRAGSRSLAKPDHPTTMKSGLIIPTTSGENTSNSSGTSIGTGSHTSHTSLAITPLSSPPKSPTFTSKSQPSSPRSPVLSSAPASTTTTLETPDMQPKMIIPSSTTGSLGQFLTPPTVYENEVLRTSTSTPITSTTDYHSDGSTTEAKETELTGAARRRKRSSAARALKDKIAAETVDLELMKDVQNWLRSLRLHKYDHAFIGLQWQQVIRMTDQDMIDAGVNTIGARRKLLKVFENVQRHCHENAIDY
ncbi:hypothetical protein BCR42DRAFT_450279 [Absidia repens]|uniref:SAM domain-containing protein n=1 Tax=Absidia repens TaxID=90262 RepID=A0A1X2IJH5_9FUNG|nr:hypothetical protein BCR42DRAFT_450279 [Absidia repens]